MWTNLSPMTKAGGYFALAVGAAVVAVLVTPALGTDGAGIINMLTPLAAVLVMLLVVTRDGYRQAGWQRLGSGQAGFRSWWVALFGPLLPRPFANASCPTRCHATKGNQYVGDYQVGDNLTLRFRVEGGELLITAAGQPPIELQAESATSFLVVDMDIEIEFVKDASSQVSDLTSARVVTICRGRNQVKGIPERVFALGRVSETRVI